MHIRDLIGWAALCLLAVDAAADEPDLEQELRMATGKAVAAVIFDSQAAAVAICEDARKLIRPDSPAYLGFHIERCLAAVAELPGVNGGERCPHYRAEIAIWQASPPPVDPSQEDAAIAEARFLREAKADLAKYCSPGTEPPPPRDPNAMLIQPLAGGVLETQEGLVYSLPSGFGVSRFDPDSGAADLRDPNSDVVISVTRKGRSDRFTSSSDYPQRETMPSGAVLAWEYTEFVPGSGVYVLFGRVTLPDAYVVLGSATGPTSTSHSVDKAVGLQAFRAIAATVRVAGPRRCIGECGPGALKAQ